MEFKFDSTQDFQIRAIDSAASLFDGQSKTESGAVYVTNVGFVGFPNRLDLSMDDILHNLKEVQIGNGLTSSDKLEIIEREIDTAEGKKRVDFYNFSIEMETGTGKTYVYLRTALELNKRFGWRRFIIVVPSIAIKEGVIKTLEITKKHFRELFENQPYRFYSYDSSNLTSVRQFASSSNVEFMIMTLDSFNKSMTEEKKGNIIRRPTDRLQGTIPIHLVQAARPILILDEPQNMESKTSVAALAALNPLFALRYSATHRNPYNLIYRLTPADAYRQGLVKKIEVASVLKENDVNQVYLRVVSIVATKKTIAAKVSVNKLMKGGSVKATSITVRPGDKLLNKTNLPDYASFEVEEINPGTSSLLFTNGIALKLGESRGEDKTSIFEAQIYYTIEEHFKKQEQLKGRGIKVLSLFFIDKVDNYKLPNGIIRSAFEKAFNELRSKYPPWNALSPDEVQAAYFAENKSKATERRFEDSVSGESQKDEAAYDLIMKDKERLLSFESKQAFIFSHSALRLGWDNPNVFQICSLNQTTSEMKRRQEVGRGVRLAVNQNGERITDFEVNRLTVVANESYESFVGALQDEIIEDYGPGVDLPPKPPNANTRTTINLRKAFVLKPEFKGLWDRIKERTKYSVTISTEKLVNEVVKEIDLLSIKSPRVAVTKARVELDSDDVFEPYMMSNARTLLDLSGRYPLPNLTDLMLHLLENTTPPIRLSRKTLVLIYSKTKNKQAAMDNPFEFATQVVRVLKEKLADYLIEGIMYEKVDQWYELTELKDSVVTWQKFVIPASKSVYDQVAWDSNVEREFVESLDRTDSVKMYIKLPPWFTVDTPVGKYNPDWAIVWEENDSLPEIEDKRLYLVRETKDIEALARLHELRPNELRKVICGEKHFRGALGVDYKVVRSVSELPEGGISFVS